MQRLSVGQLNRCNKEYNRCIDGLIPNIGFHQYYAAYTYCLGPDSGGIFDLPEGCESSLVMDMDKSKFSHEQLVEINQRANEC